MVFRNRLTNEITVSFPTTFELKSNERLIYCQAVEDLNKVKIEFDDLLFGLNFETQEDINDKIIGLVELIQVIANESPLQGFKPL